MKIALVGYWVFALIGQSVIAWSASFPDAWGQNEPRGWNTYYWQYPIVLFFYLFNAYCILRPYSFSLSWKRAFALSLVTLGFAWVLVVSAMHGPSVHWNLLYLMAIYFFVLVAVGIYSLVVRWRLNFH